MPSIFLSHGAPPLADDTVWRRELADWSASIPKPTSVLVVSAHWEAAPLMVGATTTIPLVYDFWGFAPRYYEVQYPAPGAPELATEVAKLIGGSGAPLHQDPDRGLDHGAYVPLAEMYPEADVPVLQMSLPTLDPSTLFDIGKRLTPLREQGVLIMGSGFSTHNLGEFDPGKGPDAPAPAWSSEFDDWLDEELTAGNVDNLIDFQSKAPAARTAHPRTEHFAPLFVTLGAATSAAGESVIDGFWYGMSKRSVEFA